MYEYKRTARGGVGALPPRATALNLPPGMGTLPPRATALNLPPGMGALPPRATALNLPPGMGWTGGFYLPEDEQRFSMQTCSGSAATPMDPSADLICGRSAEVNYLNNIGCVPVGFRGSHHCLTDNDHQGIFYCCPPDVLDAEMAKAAGEGDPQAPLDPSSPLRTGLFFGLGALALTAIGYVTYADWKDKRDEREALEYYAID